MPAVTAERLPGPSLPLTPDLRADVARRRADGRSWDAVGSELGFDPAALRRACSADPAFAAEVDAAVAEAGREGELRALARLRELTASDDERVALKASEAILKHARGPRREPAEPKAAGSSVAGVCDPGASRRDPAPGSSPGHAARVAPASQRPATEDRRPAAKPAGAFRAVPDLPPEKLAALLPEG